MRACVGRKGGPRLRSRASSCGASQAHGHRPVAQGEARKARAQSLRCQCRVGGVRLHLKPLAIRRVGSMVDRSDARSPAKRLPRRELTLSWIGRPWVLRSSLRVEKDSRTDRQMWNPGSCRCRVAGAERGKPRLKRTRRLRVQSRILRMMVCLSALLRGSTTSRNTPAPSSSAGPAPSARLYVRFLRSMIAVAIQFTV